MRKALDRSSISLAVVAWLAISSAAHAQDADQVGSESSYSSGLQEIVVTATRREERLQDVPIAVTALTDEVLEQKQITNVDALQRSAPNLAVAPFGDRTTSLVSLRGQVSSDNISSIDPAVGIYLDGVYIARSTGGNLSFIDVERVEVLRGPQGTLFGRNTIGGAISISAKRPTDGFEGSIAASYGNYDAWSLTGVANLPVASGVAFRVVGQHSERDGFAKSTLTGAELNAENLDYVRGSLSVDVGSNWSVLLTGDYTKSKNQGQWITLLKALPLADTVAGVVSGGTQTATQYVDPFTKRVASTMGGPFTTEAWGGAATIEGHLGAVNVKSITAYREMSRFLNDFDQDGTPFELLQLDNKIDQDQFSQEVQLFGSALGDKLKWIVGAYYFEESATDTVIMHFIFPVNPNYVITDGSTKNKSKSIFGQIEYAFTDRLSALAGVRYVKDTRAVTLRNRLAGATPADVFRCQTVGATLPDCSISPPKKSFDYVPFTIGLNFKPTDDVLLYAKWSRGFRSGGFNLRANSTQSLAPFGPERLDSYELGVKADIGRILRINAAVFQSRFSQIQFTTAQDAGGGVTVLVIDNAGRARINGAEVEATLSLQRLQLNASLGILDPKYTKLEPTAVGVTKDSPFTFTPKVTYSLGASYSIPTDFAEIMLQADYSWRDKIAYGLAPPADQANVVDSYGVLNARISA